MLRSRSRNWLFTINNPVLPLVGPLLFAGFRNKPIYAIWQLELGDNGTPHYQGYAVWSRDILGSTVSRMFGCAPHLEKRRGKHSEVTLLSFKILISPDVSN